MARVSRFAVPVAITAVLATVVTLAIVAPGADETQLPPQDSSVWALQTSDGRRYAKVNTQLAELETVKDVINPVDIASYGTQVLVFTDNFRAVAAMSAAFPTNITEDDAESLTATPTGTRQAVSAGDFVAYLTDSGELYRGRISDGTAVSPQLLDPYADSASDENDDRPYFQSAAISVADDGTVVGYDPTAQSVVVFSGTSLQGNLSSVVEGPDGDDVQVSYFDGSWAVFDTESGALWVQGQSEATQTGRTASARVQSATTAKELYIADSAGLLRITRGGEPESVIGGTGAAYGTPARPIEVGGEVYAAWLPEGSGPGTLWTSEAGVRELPYNAGSLTDEIVPVLRSNGSRVVLNENSSGWVWDVVSAALVSSSQNWNPDEQLPQDDDEEETVQRVTDPRPPVAVDDHFGVRAGRQVYLPSLLNDYDANGDVITIIPDSVSELNPAFGRVGTANDDQSLVVTVAPDATGSATFTYRVTDGTSSDGLNSQPATVTLTVSPESENSAPVWCEELGCLAQWPSLQVAPGGTVSANVLTGWVDPDGDPMYVLRAESATTAGTVAVSPDGLFTFQHHDANAAGGGTVEAEIVVSDSRGATASKTISVAIVGEPQLELTSFATSVTANRSAVIDLRSRLSGARGPVTIVDLAQSSGADEAQLATVLGSADFTFRASTPGVYVIDATVTDGTSTTEGSIRVTVLAEADEQLTVAPVTAFVNAREDVTLDPMSAVSNPGGHILLISDVEIISEDGAQLAADIIGQSMLRLSGSTADGQAGTLGTVRYTVTDGSGRANAMATGEITVVMLGAEVPPAPLAVDDAISVRVGTLTEIQPLLNDIAPPGHVIVLDPLSVTAPEEQGLVFASGRRVRYLAPDTPGTYVVPYSTYVLGYPTQTATAQIVVTVLDSPSNQKPAPRELTGRVTAGQSVSIPFTGAGLDPDGDSVRLLRIESQPESGTASISAEGTAIVYQSLANFSGQASFNYTVIDGRGATATATVRVGVLGAELDPSPIAYTDYVQVQAGANSRVSVDPVGNDIDLRGGELELVEIIPDAPLGSQEFRELSERIISVNEGLVTLSAGSNPGTASFLYTVRNTSGSTSVGRVIVKAVRERVPDLPIIRDTLLDQESRRSFTSGVDVLSGKVTWNGGDVSNLRLELWREDPTLTVSGSTISGPLPDETRLIPFKVSGQNYVGEDVTAYGFLRVPGARDALIGLKSTFVAPQVLEGEAINVDLLAAISYPSGETLEIDASSAMASGARGDSQCSVNGNTLRYTAALGDPYTDTCRVSARLGTQREWTVVAIPIDVIALEPQPTLSAAALTISPGSTSTFDMAGMVSWPPGFAGRAVTYAHNYNGSQFEVTANGSVLTITALDRSVPGREEAITVSLPSDPETVARSITLQVGPAPSLLPKGATVFQECSQASGNSCNIRVIGGSGEVNPLPGTPLEVTSVSQSPECSAVTFELGASGFITASWPSGTQGVVCNTSFSVVDAQGRVSSTERVGSLTLDLRGFPHAPGSVQQTGVSIDSVTLTVTPGPAASAYPTIDGFRIYEGSTLVTTCGADGSCPAITGLVHGQHHNYTARAFSAVGESSTGVSTTAWSYAPPTMPTVVASPVVTPGDGKIVQLQITNIDPTTARLDISSPSGATTSVNTGGATTVTVPQYNVGSNASSVISVVPVSNAAPPTLPGQSQTGTAATASGHGIGRPIIASVAVSQNSAGDQATFAVSLTPNGDGSTVHVGRWDGASCVNTVSTTSASVTLNLPLNAAQRNDVTLCGYSEKAGVAYGQAAQQAHTVYSWQDPGAPVVASGWTVDDTCHPSGGGCAAGITGGPSVNPAANGWPYIVQYRIGGGSWNSAFSPGVGPIGSVEARWCLEYSGGSPICSSSTAPVTAADSTRAYAVTVAAPQCVAGAAPSISVQANSADYSVTWTMFDEFGVETTDPDLRAEVRADVTFTNQLSGIAPWQSALIDCPAT